MKIVKIENMGGYTIPTMCCACGKRGGTLLSVRFIDGQADLKKVKKVNIAMALKANAKDGDHKISMSFPACEDCLSDHKRLRSVLEPGAIIGGIIGFLAVLVFLGSEQFEIAICGGIILLPIAIGVGKYVAMELWERKQDPGSVKQVKERYHGVESAVKIIKYKHGGLFSGKGYITLRFSNDDFAEAFKRANEDVVLEYS